MHLQRTQTSPPATVVPVSTAGSADIEPAVMDVFAGAVASAGRVSPETDAPTTPKLAERDALVAVRDGAATEAQRRAEIDAWLHQSLVPALPAWDRFGP